MSTGLSLLAVVENNGDAKMLRLGPVSYSLFACIDEFNKLTNVDQEKFFGVMQEGYFSTNKFGINQKITSAATILSSLNPPEGSRSNPDSDGKIDLTDVNIIAPIWDRFDFKFYIPPMSEHEVWELANAKAEQEGREVPDYSRFIKRWITYAKQNYNPKLTREAKSVLVEAYTEMSKKNNNSLSPRRLEALFNATKARARFLLKDTADLNDAIAVVKFYRQMVVNYEQGIIEPKDVTDVAAEECFKILGETQLNMSVPYTVKELLEKACNRNPQVEKYIKSGMAKKDYFDRSNNKQARVIYERLMSKHPEIQIVSKNPTTLLLPKKSDQSD
jgi:DNA replicative helicase MCM subunit Mcm2 (Cdc46/Mcm family)